MAGELKIKSEGSVLKTYVETNNIHGYQKDAWRQVPLNVMNWFCKWILVSMVSSFGGRRCSVL